MSASTALIAAAVLVPDACELGLDFVVGLGIDRDLRPVAILVQLGLALLVHLGPDLLRLLLHVCTHDIHHLPCDESEGGGGGGGGGRGKIGGKAPVLNVGQRRAG